eukprot:8224435-Alexandrium_andersonii.AAC.1
MRAASAHLEPCCDGTTPPGAVDAKRHSLDACQGRQQRSMQQTMTGVANPPAGPGPTPLLGRPYPSLSPGRGGDAAPTPMGAFRPDVTHCHQQMFAQTPPRPNVHIEKMAPKRRGNGW